MSPPGSLGWFVAQRPAAGFSHVASNILVAGEGGPPLAERSLSGTANRRLHLFGVNERDLLLRACRRLNPGERPLYFCGPPASQQTISVTRYLNPAGGTRWCGFVHPGIRVQSPVDARSSMSHI
jgi:hypothetical protein